MVFSTPLFLFGFLPIVLAVYFSAPRSAKNAVLLLASLAFYTWGERQYSWILFASLVANYFAGMCLGRWRSKPMLIAAIAVNLCILIACKYANFLADNLNALVGYDFLRFPQMHLPLGVSFFTFQGIAYVVDVYTHQVKPAPNLVRYALYAALFPHLVAGPIVRYRDIEDQLADRPPSLDMFTTGIRRLLVGLAKKLILANTLGFYADLVFKFEANQLSPGLAWLGLSCYTLQIYFDFSGYSDMAIGLGKMFGFTFLENFNFPYIATSITDFWRRWHISLSSWLRDYLYIPLGGNRLGVARTFVNLMIVFLLCGLWHGAKWSFLVWGAWHGAFLIAERMVGGFSIARNPNLEIRKENQFRISNLGFRIYTLLVVMLGWVFFRAETLSQATSFIGSLVGAGSGRLDVTDLWNRELVLALLLAVSCCMPIIPWCAKRRTENDLAGWRTARLEFASLTACIVLWFVIVPCLCAGSYNPFLYFRF